MNTCIMNLLPSQRNTTVGSATTTFMLNMERFSQKCVTRNPYGQRISEADGKIIPA
jgi:hypothetical protein